MRELQNVIQRVLLSLPGNRHHGARPGAAAARRAPRERRGSTGFVEGFLDGPEPGGGRYQAALAAMEAPLISAAMLRTHGNQLKAAELLGMNRNTLRERMRALGMKPKE